MSVNFDILDTVKQQLIHPEKVCENINALNNNINSNDEFILYVNIRSIEANFSSLEIFIESLKTKPFYIVCVETWTVKHLNFYSLPGYKKYYNNSIISRADGVLVYMLEEIVENTEIFIFDRLRILNTTIQMKNGSTTDISTVYRSHQMPKSEFILSLKLFLNEMRNVSNHYIIGDFNIDLLEVDYYSHEFLNNFLERGYIPGYQNYSMYRTITVGVPQGTILGPLLFILYVNDLLNRMLNETIMSYADDTAVISSSSTWKEAELKMNSMLEEVSQWLIQNKLSLNVNKTVYITFGCYSSSVPDDTTICINGIKINRVDNYKYLGIYFDFNLKWDKHINYIISKTKCLVFVFYKLSKVMPPDIIKIIYYAFFHSIIAYGNIAWGGAYNNNLIHLQTLQNRLLKIMNKNTLNKFVTPVNLEQLFALESLCYHYDTLKSKFMATTSITRNKLILLPKINKTISNKSSYIKAIKIFNLLPYDLKCLVKSKKTIKKKLLVWIVNNLG